MTWHGGIIHSATGVKFGGVNGYGDTGFMNPVDFNNATSCHVSLYSRETFPYSYAFGNGDSYQTGAGMLAILAENVCYYSVNTDAIYGGTPINAIKGLFTFTRRDASDQAFYKRSVGQNVNHVGLKNFSSFTPGRIFIGAVNQNSANNPGFYSQAHLSCVTIGDGLTESQNQSLYEIIEAFQTALNRGGL
jgi:hypothetical protein